MTEPLYRVLFHLDESDGKKQEAVLRNVNNLLDDLGPEQAQVELVTHGPGIELLTGQTGLADQVRKLIDRGVIMAICNNTLRERRIPREQVLPGAQVVSSGVGELVRRQREGWLYVRP
jgi:intracellular sulfur oxidation DsrE/DsrF family protein